jgi:phospholipid/cholesterol/gamma-HCH transport system ATP-binding protein
MGTGVRCVIVDASKSQSADARAKPASVRIVDLHKGFGQREVLKGIDMTFRPGRTTVVLGPSGCGKSVMLKHIPGLLRPDQGEIWFDDTRVDTIPERQLGPIRRRIGFLFQNSALFDSMNVRENVGFPLREHTRLRLTQRNDRIGDILAQVDMAHAIDQMPAELSGGQRKRVALARAIVLNPSVILYDEPTTGLDPIRADEINDLIIRMKNDLGVTSIVVTHDLGSAFKVADDMIMLHDGRVLACGSPNEILKHPDSTVQRFLSGQSMPNVELPAGAVPSSISAEDLS